MRVLLYMLLNVGLMLVAALCFLVVALFIVGTLLMTARGWMISIIM